MAKYVLCPRCELNFIDEEKQEYCEVCVKEMQGAKTFADDFEAEEFDEETELCPVCGENYMAPGEKMCSECKKKTQYEDEPSEDDEEGGDAWRSYLDDDGEELELGIPDSEFEGELEEDVEEEEEEETYEEDDFEYVSADDYSPDDDDEDDDDDAFDDDDAPTPRSGSKKRRSDDDF